MEKGNKTHIVFQYSLGGRNIFMHGCKRWSNPYEKIDRGQHQHIRMNGILVLRFILVLIQSY